MQKLSAQEGECSRRNAQMMWRQCWKERQKSRRKRHTDQGNTEKRPGQQASRLSIASVAHSLSVSLDLIWNQGANEPKGEQPKEGGSRITTTSCLIIRHWRSFYRATHSFCIHKPPPPVFLLSACHLSTYFFFFVPNSTEYASSIQYFFSLSTCSSALRPLLNRLMSHIGRPLPISSLIPRSSAPGQVLWAQRTLD